jgi:hypothetical protein
MRGGIGTIIYLFFRLAPFIILSFFAINFFYNYDTLILLYFLGIILASIITAFLSSYYTSLQNLSSVNKYCSLFDFTTNGPISTLPLSILILSFTFFYLGYILLKYGLIHQNLPILIILPILIAGDITWHTSTGCGNIGASGMSLVLGTGLGIFWAYIVDSTSKKDLSKFIQLDRKKDSCTLINNKYVCS